MRNPMPGVRPVKAGWYNVFRPWTLHGAVVPILIGGVVALHDGVFDLPIFLLVLAGGILLQSAANILNTYGDFKKGVDTVENEVRSPELVTGKLKPKSVLKAGAACIGAVCLIGIVLLLHAGWPILVYGVLGVIGAGTYTVCGSYKYLGLGQASVFLMMGLLMPLGTYCAMSGELFCLEVLLLSLPNAFMITAVLAGNEMRDYDEDRRSGVGTLSQHLSYENGMRLYLFENIVAFPLLAALIALGCAPLCTALAFLTLYDLLRLVQNSRLAPADAHAGFMLVPLAFKLNWHFGVLLTAGYLIQYYALPLVM